MDLIYLADTHIPSRATSGIQIMRMCAAFAENGIDVTLVHPYRFGNRPEGFDGDVHAFYGVPASFRRIILPTPLTLRLASRRRYARLVRGAPLGGWLFARSRPRAEPFVVYSRSLLGTWLSQRARRIWGPRSACRGIFFEAHDAPTSPLALKTVAGSTGVVTITDALRYRLSDDLSARAPPMFTAHSAADVAPVTVQSDLSLVRHRLQIRPETTVVAYTGRVTAEKGWHTILEAARLLRSRDFHFLVVGKVYEPDAERAARECGNITLTGFVPPAVVRSYVEGSDLLLVPTSKRLEYADFTSPLKLVECLASGRPVVCANLPVHRELVDDGRNAALFEPDDPHGLAYILQDLKADAELRSRLVAGALADAKSRTWTQRAKRVVSWIHSISNEASSVSAGAK
jgi:glycosyltransferase involved in cell wall biosynthesis